MDITIRKYEKHQSIKRLNIVLQFLKSFHSNPDEVKMIIKDLKNSKSVGGEIPTKILKECEFTIEMLTQCVNKSFASGEFNRLSDYVGNIFNVILCGFRKVHCTQHALFQLLQPWQKELDENGMVVTVLLNLYKAYACISHDR